MNLIIDAARKIVDSCNEKALAELGCYVHGPINIELSNRMTRTWGYATCVKGVYTIRLNGRLFDDAHINTTAFTNLVIHEYCHLIDHVVNKKWTHGRSWESFMRLFGIPANVFVTADEKSEIGYVRTKRLITKYEHHCQCRTHVVTGTVHNKIMRGARYSCKTCNNQLSTIFKPVKS